jgi:hypothetical protein
VIRELVDRALRGEPLYALATDLNNPAIPTVTGKQWSIPVLKRLLCSGRISGQREHQPRPRSETKRRVVGDQGDEACRE